MDLLAGAAFSWCVVYVLLSVFFAVLVARRPDGASDYATFAATCVLVGAYAYCNGQQYHQLDPVRASQWGLRAHVVVPLAVATMLHTSVLYAELSTTTQRRAIVVAYVLAGALAVSAVLGLLHRVGEVQARTLSLGGVRYIHNSWATTPARGLAYGIIVAGLGCSVFLLVRAYLAGKREALLACLGGFVLVGTAVNDTLVAIDVHRALYLSEHGFSAFAFGLSYTLLARHQRVSDELTLKGAELRRRARQLRKAYEELRAAQEELVRKEQLALVGELAAVVSHEVRNPLAIISNAVAGLRRDSTSPEDRAMLLSILDEETERLNRLVGDLLRYAKPMHVERQRLDFDALLGRATELSRGYNAVRLELDIAWRDGSADPPPVYGDANLLRQVFDNLVQNACQAMTSGGTLTVRARSATEDDVPGVIVEVADTGEGMDTQVRSRAGTPFFTTRPGGTGLGLAICDRTVTAHGGVLAIKSRSGEGTVVSVFLPSNTQHDMPPLSATRPGRVSTLPPISEASARLAETGDYEHAPKRPAGSEPR